MAIGQLERHATYIVLQHEPDYSTLPITADSSFSSFTLDLSADDAASTDSISSFSSVNAPQLISQYFPLNPFNTFCEMEKWALTSHTISDIVTELDGIRANVDQFNNLLYSTLFYFIKRHQSLQQFVQHLAASQPVISQRMLINSLLLNSDDLFRYRVVTYLSQANPVPLTVLSHDTITKSSLLPEAYWILDNSKPLIFSYGLEGCKGKSTLINQLFGTSFETSNGSLYFNGTIDYQTDQLTASKILLADGHGILDETLMRCMRELADVVLLQVCRTQWRREHLIQHEVAFFKGKAKALIILVWGEFSTGVQRLSMETIADDVLPIIAIGLPCGELRQEITVDNLRLEIMKFIPKPPLESTKFYNDKQASYLEMLSYNQKLINIVSVVHRLTNYVTRAPTHAVDYPFLKLYPLFKKIQLLKSQVSRTRLVDRDIIEKRAEIANLYETLRRLHTEAEIITDFKSIVANPFDPLTLLITKDAIKRSHAAHISSDFSTDLIWREINQIYLHHYHPDSRLSDGFQNMVALGEPFEIVDGDCFYFPYEFLSNMLTVITSEKRLLTIGAVGPQNSGKSTLLNYMFGCHFAASDGKTTKGVYGSIVKSPIENYDILLVLDTEGVMSKERADPDYERKLMLFTLATCNVVILNVSDQIDDPVSRMFDVCTSALSCMEQATSKPTIYFVQNKKQNNNISVDIAQQILQSLSQNHMDKLLDITEANFVAFPLAFNIEWFGQDQHQWRRTKTVPRFREQVAEFTSKVLRGASNKVPDSSLKPFHDVPTWLLFAYKIFDTVRKFSELTKFSDVSAQNDAKHIQIQVINHVSDIISLEKKGTILSSRNFSPTKIKEYLGEELKCAQKEIREYCAANHLATSVCEAKLQELDRIIHATQQFWCMEATILSHQQSLTSAITNGHKLINEKLNELFTGHEKYTEESAYLLFNEYFNQVCADLTSKRANLEKKEAATRPSLVSLYELYCSELPQDLHLCRDANEKNQQLLHDLERTHFHNVVYVLPMHARNYNRLLTPNNRIILDQSVIEILQGEVAQFLLRQPSATEFDPVRIAAILRDSTTNKPAINLAKWLEIAKDQLLANLSSTVVPPARWPSVLVPALHKTLHQNPELLKKLILLDHAFAYLHKCAYELIPPASLATASLIQECAASVVARVINPCNEELSALGLAFTPHAKGYLHELMLHHLLTSQGNYYKQYIDKTFNRLRDNTLLNLWQDNFISQAVRGPDRDTKAVLLFKQTFAYLVYSSCTEQCQTKISIALSKFAATRLRAAMQKQIEQNLQQMSDEELIEYIASPPTFIVSKVDREVDAYIVALMAKAEGMYKSAAAVVRDSIAWLQSITIEPSGISKANDLLRSDDAGVSGVLSRKEVAAGYIFKHLLNGSKCDTYTIGRVSMLVAAQISIRDPPSSVAAKYLSMLIEAAEDVHSISDFRFFIDSLLVQLDLLATQLSNHKCRLADFDTGNTLQEMRSRAAGCRLLCPCCLRCCDEDHTWQKGPIGTDTNRHKCNFGHQYRSLAYIKETFDKQETRYNTRRPPVSLQLCQNMSDLDEIYYDNSYMQWHEIKSRFPTWDFSSPTSQEQDASNPMSLIWCKVGRKLSLQISDEPTLPTQHGCHYLIAISGTPATRLWWHSFQTAMQEFARVKQTENPDLQHTISIFTFSSTTEIKYLLEDERLDASVFPLPLPIIKQNEILSISKALDEIVLFVQNYTRHAPLSVIFISSAYYGEFPLTQVQRLTQSSVWTKINSFWAISMIWRGENLEKITKWLKKGNVTKGFFREVVAGGALPQVFSQIR